MKKEIEGAEAGSRHLADDPVSADKDERGGGEAAVYEARGVQRVQCPY